MRKRVQIALAVLLVAVGGVLVWQVLLPREPVYEGKRLSRWLEEYAVAQGMSREAEYAIRRIGANAIPVLLSMLRQKDSALYDRTLRPRLRNQLEWCLKQIDPEAATKAGLK